MPTSRFAAGVCVGVDFSRCQRLHTSLLIAVSCRLCRRTDAQHWSCLTCCGDGQHFSSLQGMCVPGTSPSAGTSPRGQQWLGTLCCCFFSLLAFWVLGRKGMDIAKGLEEGIGVSIPQTHWVGWTSSLGEHVGLCKSFQGGECVNWVLATRRLSGCSETSWQWGALMLVCMRVWSICP